MRQGTRYTAALPPFLTAPEAAVQTQSDVLDRLEDAARGLLEQLDACGWDPTAVHEVVAQRLGTTDAEVCRTLRFACEVIVPRLERTPDEIANILHALQGEYVPAGPSGAPTRGLAHVLPTGRNFYSVDPKTLPSPSPTRWARIWPGHYSINISPRRGRILSPWALSSGARPPCARMAMTSARCWPCWARVLSGRPRVDASLASRSYHWQSWADHAST